MIAYDEITKANSDDTYRSWIRKVIDLTNEIVAFVDNRLDSGGAREFIGFLKGLSSL
jgi:hypothetical protein